MLDDEFLGNDILNVSVSDGADDAYVVYVLDLISVNDTPVITEFIGNDFVLEDTPFDLGLNDFTVEDPDNLFPGDFSASGLSIYDGENYSVNGSTVVPDSNFYGIISIPVSVNDGLVESSTFIFELNVQPVNDAPQINSSELASVTEDVYYGFIIEFIDVDGSGDLDDYTVELSGNALPDNSTV